ncbi:hypothetical protein SCP_0400600 [Sparassis crispa]|uniref:Uncharacterized protein n=1 Tax=Sparassis crispa TaxID=139825 RepID=A0A401GHP8_9APHY|nr:hypothetical protein SCP_0400600 [Sparassis crispa]GBE81689.1 hypothetical protein SCP_0400600 [Sparassis crispa]
MFSTYTLRRVPLLLRRLPSSTTPRSLSTFSRSAFIKPPYVPGVVSSSVLRSQIFARGAASTVSGRPGSQSVGQAATNIKEELGNSTADLAKVIAGGNVYTDAVQAREHTFLGITNAVAHSVPTPYIVFGLAGGLPYLGTAVTTAYLAREAGLATAGITTYIDPGVAITVLDQALHLQVTYGAVMLSFLGALHWGFEFAGYGGNKGYTRLLLGAAPVVFGWSTLALQPLEALIAQWVGFTGLWWADLRATNAGWTPQWYSQYRFYLSVLVGTCIIGTLATTSYWGPVGGHGLVSHDLDMVRAERKQKQPEQEGLVGGEVETVAGGDDADTYVVIKHKHHEGEQGGEQEQQQQQQQQ